MLLCDGGRDVEVMGSTDAAYVFAGSRRSKVKRKAAAVGSGGSEEVAAMKEITKALTEVVVKDSVAAKLRKDVLDCAARYEEVLIRLLAENGRLKGHLEVGVAAGLRCLRRLSRWWTPLSCRMLLSRWRHGRWWLWVKVSPRIPRW